MVKLVYLHTAVQKHSRLLIRQGEMYARAATYLIKFPRDYHHSLLNDLNGFKSHESTLSITFGELDSVSLMSCTVETNYHTRHFFLSPAGSICMQTASDRNWAPGSFLASINHFVFTQTSENINMCSLPPCEPGVSSQSAQTGLWTQI